jgi:hypothetical protein
MKWNKMSRREKRIFGIYISILSLIGAIVYFGFIQPAFAVQAVRQENGFFYYHLYQIIFGSALLISLLLGVRLIYVYRSDESKGSPLL